MHRSSWSVSSDRVAESCRRREISARNFSQGLVPVKTSSCVRDVDTNGVAERPDQHGAVHRRTRRARLMTADTTALYRAQSQIDRLRRERGMLSM